MFLRDTFSQTRPETICPKSFNADQYASSRDKGPSSPWGIHLADRRPHKLQQATVRGCQGNSGPLRLVEPLKAGLAY